MRYLVASNYVTPGAISWGTLKSEDLMKAFADEIDRLSAYSPSVMYEAYEWLEGNHEQQGDEQAASEIVNDLIDWLDSQCPKGLYFGTAEGDGTEFGFWETEEE